MARNRKPTARGWRWSQILVVGFAASPFAFLVWAGVVSVQADAEMSARVANEFVDVECVVTDSAVRTLTRNERVGGNAQAGRDAQGHVRGSHMVTLASGFEPVVQYRYEVRGVVYHSRRFAPALHTLDQAGADAFLLRYDEGSRHRCRHDPQNPGLAFIAD